MINITDKQNCCGCSACVQACPKQCISFKEDDEGFFYPKVDVELCINCGLCEKVCPYLNQSATQQPLKVYAAINPNEEIRMKSSSGGIFTMLAEEIIDTGGVVFGACFDENWEVKHDYTKNKEGLEVFRGSKYVQSRIGNTFKQAREFLIKGRMVLYSGTPCQIAGLKRFLCKEYDNLLTVEIACHGVPSPMIWRKYLEEIKLSKKMKKITKINFRNKIYGWNGYQFSLDYLTTTGQKKTMITPHGDNPFYRGFLNHLYMRPSCFNCPSKRGMSGADLIIADFWGIDLLDSTLDDNKGCSTIVVNTEKGHNIICSLNNNLPEYKYDDIIKYNPALVESLKENNLSEKFWQSKEGVSATIEKLCGDPLILRLKKLISVIMNKRNPI